MIEGIVGTIFGVLLLILLIVIVLFMIIITTLSGIKIIKFIKDKDKE